MPLILALKKLSISLKEASDMTFFFCDTSTMTFGKDNNGNAIVDTN
jgi:hypothetical protein